MLKKIINHAHIDLRITPLDPLLIKSGQATVGGVEMSFVRTYGFGEKAIPYIPGSSLKGVFRSYAEKICRSLRDDLVPVCLPYEDPRQIEVGEEDHQASCGLIFEKYKKDQNKNMVPTHDVYRLSCPACRLFGSHGFVGRFAASDAYPKPGDSPLLEIRDGVAIDRFTGGAAKGAKYDLEVLTKGDFQSTLEIRNFERWQIGLIALVLRDMEDGLVRIGFGKSRGLGRIKAEITRLQITYYNRDVTVLSGLARLCTKEECQAYGFFKETKEATDTVPPLPAPRIIGLRREHVITETWREVLGPAVNDLLAYISKIDWPRELEQYVERGPS